MTFTIIIPTYNAQSSIRSCIESILFQTFSDFEIIVINDGSLDNSENIVKSYSEKDSRIKLYNFKNAGVSVSRNRGITLANGDYCLFVDSDDSINESLLEKLNQTITEFNNPDIIRYQANLVNDYCYKDHNRYNFFDSEKIELTGMNALRAWSIPNKKYAVYWLFAFKKTVFSSILTFPNLRCYEDVALIPLLIAMSQKTITIDYIGYNYTCNNLSSLTNIKSKSAEEARAIDFVKAYTYAISNFQKITNITSFGLAFFIEDYNRRLKSKFESLSDELKEKLADLFGL